MEGLVKWEGTRWFKETGPLMQFALGIPFVYSPHRVRRRAREGPPVVWVKAELGKEWRRGSINTWNGNMEEKGEILLVTYAGLSHSSSVDILTHKNHI